MTVVADFTPTKTVRCGGCGMPIALDRDGIVRCPSCNWQGEAYVFSPRVIELQTAEAALPEDATCIHHPRKKATAICAGSGDYICSLCAVELNGQTYSAEYLNSAGKEKAGQAFERELPRPDGRIRLYLILLIVPYINAVMIATVFLWMPHAWYLYMRALRMRRENALFQRLMSKTSVIVLPIILVIVSLAWLIGAIALIVLLLERKR